VTADDDRAEPSSPGPDLVDRLRAIAGVVAPTTVVTALLFYFGYVATFARFRYFGVYLDMVGLSTQDMALYGVEVIYAPLIALCLAGLLAASVHAGLSWLVSSGRRDAVSGWAGVFVILVGFLLLLRGVVGMQVPEVARTEFPGTTPTCLGLGAICVAYGTRLLRVVGRRWHRRQVRVAPGAAAGDRWWPDSPPADRIVRYGLVLVSVIVVASLFWAANSFAAAFGRGRALTDAAMLADSPEVILDTQQALADPPPGVTASELPAAAPGSVGAFRYRYRNLRLLVEGNDRLYLVPVPWQEDSRTLVIPYDEKVRIQLVPPP
jgi:hypothetical protein